MFMRIQRKCNKFFKTRPIAFRQSECTRGRKLKMKLPLFSIKTKQQECMRTPTYRQTARWDCTYVRVCIYICMHVQFHRPHTVTS